jgi:hypothetical protein
MAARQARLESLLADQDEVLISACHGGVPPLACEVAAPFQRVAVQQSGAWDQPADSPLVVAADVDQQCALCLRGVRLGGRRAVRQRSPGLH